MVECYDLLTRRWLPPSPPPPDPYPAASTSSSDASPAPPCPVRRYPEDAWEHSCVALFVPSSREDIQLLDRYANGQTDEILKHYCTYIFYNLQEMTRMISTVEVANMLVYIQYYILHCYMMILRML